MKTNFKTIVMTTVVALLALVLATSATTTATAADHLTTSKTALKAPVARWYNSSYDGGMTYVRGLTGGAGIAKYQFVRRPATGTGVQVVKTVSPAELVSFKTPNLALSVRAVDSHGHPGPLSAWIPLSNNSGKDTWETMLEMRSTNISNFAAASAKYLAKRGVGCLKDKAFNKIYDTVAKKAVETDNLYGSSAGAIALYYKKLWDMAFDDNCDLLKKVGTYSIKLINTGVNPPSSSIPLLYVTTSFDDNGPLLPRACYIHMSSIFGATGVYDFTTHLAKEDCDDQARNWYY